MFRYKAQITEDGSREAIARYFQGFATQKRGIFSLKKQFMAYSELP